MADLENKLVDKRVAHRYVRKNLVDEKEYEKYLKTLPDLAEQAAPIEASMDPDFEDDLDDDEPEEAEASEAQAAGADAGDAATPAGGGEQGTPPVAP